MDDAEVLDRALASTVAGGRVPGLAVAVVADGEVARVGTTGSADAATNVPVDPHTPFLWFSMTKIVTATAAMHLVDEGRLGLDDDVEQLVPGVLPADAAERVRVRHLLQHSAGIPNPPPIRWVRPASAPPPNPGDFVRERFARVRRLRFPPGTRAAYTNLGYLLLGAVIEAAAHKPYTTYATEAVLAPLGMHDTGFVLRSDARPVAIGHQRLPNGLGPLLRLMLPRGIVGARTGKWVQFRPFLVNGAPYGGLVGPVSDAARVLLMHANGGSLDRKRILSDDAVSQMQAITLTGRPFDHGLGWFRKPADRQRRPTFVEHYGGGGGYHNLMRLYPDRHVGVVAMGNSTSYDVDALIDTIATRWTT